MVRTEHYSTAFIAFRNEDLVEVRGFEITRSADPVESMCAIGQRSFTRQQLASVTFWCAAIRGVWLSAWAFHDGNAPAEVWQITGVKPLTGEWVAKSRPAWHASFSFSSGR